MYLDFILTTCSDLIEDIMLTVRYHSHTSSGAVGICFSASHPNPELFFKAIKISYFFLNCTFSQCLFLFYYGQVGQSCSPIHICSLIVEDQLTFDVFDSHQKEHIYRTLF